MSIKLKFTATRFIRKYGTDWNDISDSFIIKLPNNIFSACWKQTASKCTLPEMDYSSFNFKECTLKYTKFPKNSILPSNPNLFLELKNSSIHGCTMPNIDYRVYNFKGVRIKKAIFHNNSIFPSCEQVFNSCSSFTGAKIPQNSLENIHYVNKKLNKQFLKDNPISLESLYLLKKMDMIYI